MGKSQIWPSSVQVSFPTSTHRVNLRQHCHHVSAQHLPSLPEDKPGEGISLLSTWGGGGGSGEYLGSCLSSVIPSVAGQKQEEHL